MTRTQSKLPAAISIGDVLIGFDDLPAFEVRRIQTQRDGLVLAFDHSGHRYMQIPADELVKVAAQ